MKSVYVVFLLAASAFAQDRVAMQAAQSACGPTPVTFDAKIDQTQHPTPDADADKALIYVIEDLGQCVDCYGGGSLLSVVPDVSGAVIRIGADGSWIAAGRGGSYLFFSTNPGEHHICVNWQSTLEERSRAYAFTDLTVEAGKVYYLRARLFPGHADFSLDLELVNKDEGKFLVASSPLSLSHPKK
jgi:hypothetical protein